MRSNLPPRLLLVALLSTGLVPHPAGAQWLVDGLPVCTAPSNQFTPAIVSDGAGGAIVAWYDYRGGSADVYAHHVKAGGVLDPGWPPQGRALCTASGGQYAVGIVDDGAGGAIVVWQDERGSSPDIYAQHVLASGAVDPQWPADGRGVCTASDDQIYPAAITDGAGGALVTWRDYRGGPDTDVYAQRVLASGVVDPGWPAGGRALCTAAGNQSVPALAPDGAGGAFVTWSDLRDGSQSDIYAQHVLSSGAVDSAWPADGRALCTAAGNQSGPSIVEDGAGGAIVVWFDYRNGLDSDIHGQHVLGSGVVDPAWPADGRALCAAEGEQYSPLLAPDGGGGAVTAWYDYRGGAEADIYAHHLLSSGSTDPVWPADGLALCPSVGDQVSPGIVADGAGGGVVAWFDYRSGASCDIYAGRAPSSGAVDPAWPPDGLAVCTALGDQYSPALASDGEGGAIVVWTDFRGGLYSDIYVHHVTQSGHVAAVEPGPASTASLHDIRPNPAGSRVAVRLAVQASGRVTVDVLDAGGRRVRTLLADRPLSAGAHEVGWDGADEMGVRQPSGVYWVRVSAAGRASARKLALVR